MSSHSCRCADQMYDECDYCKLTEKLARTERALEKAKEQRDYYAGFQINGEPKKSDNNELTAILSGGGTFVSSEPLSKYGDYGCEICGRRMPDGTIIIEDAIYTKTPESIPERGENDNAEPS